MVIIGQAPGRRVHESGIPWHDPSGERLRRWLDLTPEQFYDPEIVALIPMGFCYPGSTASGDKPPRPECAPLWHERLLDGLPADRLEIIIGAHAQKRYLTDRKPTLTETVANWRTLSAAARSSCPTLAPQSPLDHQEPLVRDRHPPGDQRRVRPVVSE